MASLRAKKLEPVAKRLKLLLYGDYGVGKTMAAISFPRSYVLDGEHGCDHYHAQLAKSGSVVLQTSSFGEAVSELRSLSCEKHAYQTVVVDPMVAFETDLIEQAEKEYGKGDRRIWADRDTGMRRLVNLLLNLDMNVVITTPVKDKYSEGESFTKVGTTNDGWKRLRGAFDLALEIERRGARRVGIVRKTRLEGFPDGDSFDFSYAEILRRYGADAIERDVVPVALATPEQVTKLKGLVDMVKLPEGQVEAWLKKANVDSFEDMPGESVAKCISFVEAKVSAAATGGAK